MAIPNITDIYRQNIPRGKAFKVGGVWNTAITSDIVLTPKTDKAFLIEKILFFASDSLDFTLNEYMEIEPMYDLVDNISEIYYLVPNAVTQFNSFASFCEEIEPMTVDTVSSQKMVMYFRNPVFIRSSESETFEIRYTDTPNGLSAGTLSIIVCGQEINEEDAGIQVDV